MEISVHAAWSAVAFGLGWPVIAAIWACLLLQAVRLRRAAGSTSR